MHQPNILLQYPSYTKPVLIDVRNLLQNVHVFTQIYAILVLCNNCLRRHRAHNNSTLKSNRRTLTFSNGSLCWWQRW